MGGLFNFNVMMANITAGLTALVLAIHWNPRIKAVLIHVLIILCAALGLVSAQLCSKIEVLEALQAIASAPQSTSNS